MKGGFKRVLVPVDGSATSAVGLRAALQLARLLKARLRLVHLGTTIPPARRKGEGMTRQELLAAMRERGQRLLEGQASRCRARGVRTDTALRIALAGRPAKAVLAEARKWGADLIVMGTHGRRGLRRVVLGSDAEQIARQSPVPVVLVRR